MVRYAIIGTGWITKTFILGSMAEDPEMELAGVYSRSESKARDFADEMKAAAHGSKIRLYTDLSNLSEDPDIQAVYIASPNLLHTQQSRMMLEKGKHVICEKPIAIEPEELVSLKKLADEKGLIYMEAIMLQHQPQLATLKEAMSKIGTIRTAHLDFCQRSSKYDAFMAGKNPNIFNPAMQTGALEDLGVYCVHALVELFGVPSSIQSLAQFLSSGADSSGQVIADYKNLAVTITYNKTGQGRQGSEIIGDKGTIVVDSISQLTGMTLYAQDGTPTVLCGDIAKNTLMGREGRDFERLIQKAGENPEKQHQIYEQNFEKSLAVCRLMKEIRQKSGIHFQ